MRITIEKLHLIKSPKDLGSYISNFLFYVYGCFDCIYTCVPLYVWCLRTPEDGVESPGIRVTDVSHHVGAGN